MLGRPAAERKNAALGCNAPESGSAHTAGGAEGFNPRRLALGRIAAEDVVDIEHGVREAAGRDGVNWERSGDHRTGDNIAGFMGMGDFTEE
jgi:hypothetical protein